MPSLILKDDDFRKLIPKGMQLPKIDAIRNVMKVINIVGLREMLTYGIKKARENKVFDGGTIDRRI